MDVQHLIKIKSYEKIEYHLRRHWFTFVPKLLLIAVLLLVPSALEFLQEQIAPNLLLNQTAFVISVLFFSLYYLSVLLFLYEQFVVFYLDMWIVTNDRIVDVEQLGLFSRSISELDLFRIQDVTTDVKGIFPTLLNYGTLTVKTASNNINIVFKDIPHPNDVRENLIQLSHEDRKYHVPQAIITDQ